MSYPPTQPEPERDPAPIWELPPYDDLPVSHSADDTMHMMPTDHAQASYQTYVDPYSNVVQPRVADIAQANRRRADLRAKLLAISSLLTSALITLLALRFFFRLFGADAQNGIVAVIYTISQPFILGFNGIFQDHPIGRYGVFEISTLLAIVMYLILAAGVQSVIRIVLAPKSTAL